MFNYKLTNKAVEDLEKIWDYTFENCTYNFSIHRLDG